MSAITNIVRLPVTPPVPENREFTLDDVFRRFGDRELVLGKRSGRLYARWTARNGDARSAEGVDEAELYRAVFNVDVFGPDA